MPSEIERARAEVRVLVLTGLGLNCERETAEGFRLCGGRPELVALSDALAGRRARLADFHILALIGGFSFGDHLGAGVVYANRLRYRLLDQILGFVQQGGLVLGICNGFQTMIKLGLLPALDGELGRQRATLAPNDRPGYRDVWVTLRADPMSPCVWTRGIDLLDLPARHGEGKFLAGNEEVASAIRAGHLAAVRYVDERGEPTCRWPDNPNGSPEGIAGICDPSGRLFGLMPHPDAYLYGFSHPQWPRRKIEGLLAERGEGLRIFQNGVDFVAARWAGGS
ncbi:MAG: phosphoribosylformylglycinamidine synthase subunit PurQ [Deltaproteobacteria bacterium]|nr:phosphoribosylformylglycinamidine synthase subunit PurQ [Deltaproteobacteria bacterium]